MKEVEATMAGSRRPRIVGTQEAERIKKFLARKLNMTGEEFEQWLRETNQKIEAFAGEAKEVIKETAEGARRAWEDLTGDTPESKDKE